MTAPDRELHAVGSLLAEQRETLRESAAEALRALLREVALARVALQARGLPLSEVDRLPAAQRAAGEHAAALVPDGEREPADARRDDRGRRGSAPGGGVMALVPVRPHTRSWPRSARRREPGFDFAGRSRTRGSALSAASGPSASCCATRRSRRTRQVILPDGWTRSPRAPTTL